MSISLTTISTVVIDFVNQTLLPILQKSNPGYCSSLQKWQQFTETIMSRISTFANDEQLKQRVRFISGNSSSRRPQKKQPKQPKATQQSTQLSQKDTTPRINAISSKDITIAQKPQQPQMNKLKDESSSTVQFRDRKTSLDQFSGRKDQVGERKEERSGSVCLGGGGGEGVEVPLVLVVGGGGQQGERQAERQADRQQQGQGERQQQQQQADRSTRNSFMNIPNTTTNATTRKDNDVTSFNSISDFHKSRNTIPASSTKQPPTITKQPTELPLILPSQQLKMLSKKSIEDYDSSTPMSQQNRGISYSSNFIGSVKRINVESRSPSGKGRGGFDDGENEGYVERQRQRDRQRERERERERQRERHDLSDPLIQTTPTKHPPPALVQQPDLFSSDSSTLSNIKKKLSQNSDYLPSPSLGPTQSFAKFMGSFKKLCNTFESNHQKLMREDFSNKYVNC